MAVHVVHVDYINVNKNNDVQYKATMSISEATYVERQHRVLSNSDVPNSANNPTISNYLNLEYNDGYHLKHIDQYLIITDNSNTSSSGSSFDEAGSVTSDQNTDSQLWTFGRGTFIAHGTWDGATAKVQVSDDNDTWIDVGGDVTFTDNGVGNFDLASGLYVRINISGTGASTNITAKIYKDYVCLFLGLHLYLHLIIQAI